MTWRGIDLLEVCANEVRREHDRVARFDRPLYAITLVGSQNASLSVHIRNNSSSLLPISLLPFFHAKWKHTPFSRNFYPCDFNEMTIFFYNSFFYYFRNNPCNPSFFRKIRFIDRWYRSNDYANITNLWKVSHRMNWTQIKSNADTR